MKYQEPTILGRWPLAGNVGAVVDDVVGDDGKFVALLCGSEIFKVRAKKIRPAYGQLGWSLTAVPAFAALSSFIPAMIAGTEDAALILR